MHPSVLYWNWRNRIAYAPPDAGTGNAGDNGDTEGDPDDGNKDDDNDSNNKNKNDPDNKDDAEIKLDGVDLISQLFKDETDDDVIPDKYPDDIMDGKAIRDLLENGLKAIMIPDSMIPDDFNPNDRKQMSKLLSEAARYGARQTLALSFKPIENAMKSHAFDVDKNVRTRVKSLKDTGTEVRDLEESIPVYADPEHRDLVRSLNERAKKQFPKSKTNQITAIKRALVTMQIDPMKGPRNVNDKDQTRNSGVKKGAAALDAFAPLTASNRSTASQLNNNK